MNYGIERAFEREEANIWEMEARGEISNSEAWKRHNQLQREYRETAQEAAADAYQNELDQW